MAPGALHPPRLISPDAEGDAARQHVRQEPVLEVATEEDAEGAVAFKRDADKRTDVILERLMQRCHMLAEG